MTLTREELYQNLYQDKMIREPGNPQRKDKPLKTINEVIKFADRCGGNKPAFMSIYSYTEPYKVEYKKNSKGDSDRIAHYPPLVFDRIILDFDIKKDDLLFKEGYNSEMLLNKGKELIDEYNKDKPEDKQMKATKRNCMTKGDEYYREVVKQDDRDNIKELTRNCKTKKDKDNAVMDYYYRKYTSKEYLGNPYKDAVKTANYIKDLFGITPILFFSGGHGIHLHILFNPVDVPNPNAIVKEFGFKLKKELDLQTLDKTVVQGVNKHLIRIPLSRHQTTKLYVVPFDLKTSYLEMLDFAVTPDINVNLDFEQDTTLFEDFIKSYSDFLEKTKKEPKKRNVEYEYTLNGSVFDLQEPFSRIYIEGQRNYTAHPLIHFFKGAGIPKEDVEQFFDTLPVGTGLDKNVQTWIDTAYKTDKPYQDNLGYFINTVKNYAINKEDADHIIKKFNEYFNPKGKEIIKDLEAFTIGTDARQYPVKATIVNDKYTKIEIIDLLDNKAFNFVLDIKNNVCKFVSDKMDFEMKYTFNQGGFKLKSETQFKTVKKDISDILGIKIPDAFKYSLSSYLGALYPEIESKNMADIGATANALDIDVDDEATKLLIFDIICKLDERTRTTVEQGRRQLSTLLTDYYGVILRKHIGTLFKINGNGFEPTSHDDLIHELTKIFGKNFIHDNDLKTAIGYISDRLEPVPNVVKFENTLYDMENLEPIETEQPLFTVLNIPYNYNPDAKSEMFEQFLQTTFARETDGKIDEDKTAEAVKGIKQICGYLLTSGNSLEILPIFTGLTGAGKSTLLNILTGIIGHDKISGISLQSLEKDIHASSGFIGRHLNIIRDSDTSIIKNNSILKTWTGNEGYPVNPKFKDLFDLPAHEVPKPILACNTMPVFAVYDDAIIRRFVIVEFMVSMTKKGEAIPDLDKKILADAEEVEWFIYECIKEYKAMIENEETFIFKISDEETKDLIEKHTHPLNHIIQMLILKHDPKAYDDDRASDLQDNFTPIFTDDLVDAILFVSDKEGIDVPVNKHGKIDKKTLIGVIREEYDLQDGEIVKDRETKQYNKHREYKARQERFGSINAKAYPNLIATEYYIKILNEVKAQRKKNQEDKGKQ